MKFFILLFGLINLFAVSTRASSYKKKKKRVHVVVSAQQKRELALKDSLRTYFANYQLEEYKVRRAFDVDSLRINDTLKEVLIYPTENFYSQPFNSDRLKQIYNQLSDYLPGQYADYRLRLFAKHHQPIEELIPNHLRTEGFDESRKWSSGVETESVWVKPLSKSYDVSKGLQDRHLMVWASHGRFYKNVHSSWEWQRPNLFCTTEDLLTQSIVYPYLLPMLENAGAIVVTPRERDAQTEMYVVDNDAYTSSGSYIEYVPDAWKTELLSQGFSVPREPLTDGYNPFAYGTVRSSRCTKSKVKSHAAVWTPKIKKAGRYAVYISYATLPNSIPDARYAVHHAGGISTFKVNQQIGGGTWVYLGTFEFNDNTANFQGVTITNQSDYEGVVTADAVRFGGGMGKSLREGHSSHLPAYLESARYYAQWAGLPEGLYNTEGSDNDYVDDLRCRSNFVNHLAGESVYLPTEKGLGVPLELVCAVHTDAGYRPDTIYGTMAISTTYDVSTGAHYPSGISRMASWDFAHLLAQTLTHDLTHHLGTPWMRRETWNRNYSETRSPQIPSAIIEMLSHQNFTDMRYAHDPYVKFYLARSIYKAILRYVNYQHGITDVVVQPLPVGRVHAALDSEKNRVELRWTPTTDSLEATAVPTHYVVYTKIGDRAFDQGQRVKSTHFSMPITPGVQYAFRVTAVNEGGESLPSEEMTVYRAQNEQARVMIVNGFTRLCGPAYVNNPDSIGFDLSRSIGIPWCATSSLAGRQLCFDPTKAGLEGAGALGYSGNELAGKVIAGNSFDFTSEHGRAIAHTKEYSFASASVSAVEKGDVMLDSYDVLDLILGRQAEAAENLRSAKTFTPTMQQRISDYTHQGGHLLVTGSHLGSDMQAPSEREFLSRTMGIAYAGSIAADSCAMIRGLNIQLPLYHTPSAEHYAVGHPDILVPASKQGFSAFAYITGHSAGVAFKGVTHRAITIGVPFECISDASRSAMAMRALLNFLTQ